MKKILLIILFPMLGFAMNFHEVDPGHLYRSAQLSRNQFNKYIQKHNIKTVINLRGAHPGERWYDEEKKAISDNPGVLHFDIGMSASRLPHKKDLAQLIDLFQNAPRPILIHCKAGVDRTGEASAIYTQEYMGWSKKDSLKMLSVRYGHVKAFKPAKSYFIDQIYQGQDWVLNSYDPCLENYEYYDKEKHCKVVPDRDQDEEETFLYIE